MSALNLDHWILEASGRWKGWHPQALKTYTNGLNISVRAGTVQSSAFLQDLETHSGSKEHVNKTQQLTFQTAEYVLHI